MNTEKIVGTLRARQAGATIDGEIATTGTGGGVWVADAVRAIVATNSPNIDQQLRGSIHLTASN